MDVPSLDDLALSAPVGKRLAVLGDPIGHSLSPAMHNAALAEMSVAAPALVDWAYTAIHVPPERLKEALSRLHAAGVVGINLTIPHKVQARALVESVDAEAQAMGAVNTLVRTEGGYRGTNTDGYGIKRAVEEAFAMGLKGADVWLFGAGGAARGIVVSCLQARCGRVTVINRTPSRLRELEEQVRSSGVDGGDGVRFRLAAEAPADCGHGSLLINATSLGLKEGDPSPIGPDYLKEGTRVYDTTYGVRNQLARTCAGCGIPYADGLSMLVWQGVRSLEIWTGEPVPAGAMRRAAEACLRERNDHE